MASKLYRKRNRKRKLKFMQGNKEKEICEVTISPEQIYTSTNLIKSCGIYLLNTLIILLNKIFSILIFLSQILITPLVLLTKAEFKFVELTPEPEDQCIQLSKKITDLEIELRHIRADVSLSLKLLQKHIFNINENKLVSGSSVCDIYVPRPPPLPYNNSQKHNKPTAINNPDQPVYSASKTVKKNEQLKKTGIEINLAELLLVSSQLRRTKLPKSEVETVI